MKMLTTLSAIALIGMSSITHATGCSDGNEPVKTVSSDGSYYEYNCGGSSSVDNSVTTINTTESGTVSLHQQYKSQLQVETGFLTIIYPKNCTVRIIFQRMGQH